MTIPAWIHLAARGSDPPPAYVAVSYVLMAVIAYFIHDFVRQEKARAKAHDHVVETSRDVAVPDHCVGCGRPHASLALDFRALTYEVGPVNAALDPLYWRKYRFRFCPTCAAPVLRRRRLGQGAIVSGLFALIMLPILLIVAQDSRNSSGTTILIIWSVTIFAFFGGWIAMFAGMIIKRRAGSAIVSVLDTGAETVLFRFQNQVYRNHFAELNGEE